MQVSHSFWDVCQQYFENGILLPIFAVAVIWLIRKWNREKRVAFLAVCGGSMLVLYNELTYQVLGIAGESSTYYRFFWLCPIALVIAYLIIELVSLAKKEQRIAVIAVMILAGILFLPRNISDWVNIPDNIYQLDEDVIQVSDALMELSEGEPTTLIDDGSVSGVIRQYNAKIGFTQKNSLYMDYVLRIDTANYLAKYMQDYIYLNESEYIAMQKEKVATYKLLESAGFSRVAETDGYYLYQVDYGQIDKDWETITTLQEGLCDEVNVEYVPIDGLGKEHEFVYISDFGSIENEAVYEEVIEQIKASDAECVFINATESENCDWVEKYEHLLTDLEVPYYCNNQDIQVVELDGVTFCLMDNTKDVSPEVIKEFELLKEQGAPIVMVLSSKLSDEKQDELYLAVTAEDSPVAHILTTGVYPDMKDIIAHKLLQYATPVDTEQIYNIIRVKGFKTE